MVDDFIAVANKQSGKTNIENVAMSMLFAASRFNVYVVSSKAENLERFEKEMVPAADFFIKKYTEMLGQNLIDYQSMYEPTRKFTDND